MRIVSAYKKRAVLIMIVVMSFHILSGSGLLCAREHVLPVRAGVGEDAALAGSLTDRGSAEVSVGTSPRLDNRSGPAKCSCKKKQKCAAIPRAIITSNPTHRVSEFQRQAKSVCCDALVPQMTTEWFAAKSSPPLMELGNRAPTHCFTPLSLSCILLI
jgi:hypothetical protein